MKPTEIARQTLALMAQHQVDPTPMHYAVWYGFVEGSNKELVQEIDKLVNKGAAFTKEILAYLHNRYIQLQGRPQQLEQASIDLQIILSEILHMVDTVGSDASSYNEHLSEFGDNVGKKQLDKSVKLLIDDVLLKTRGLIMRGNKLNERLDESRHEIAHLRRRLDEVTTESQKDFLTGVANRKAFDAMLQQMVKRCTESNTPLSLLMIDIDHFKQFNDKFGHQIGDEVLKTVARNLTDGVKGKDYVARYGGEEFTVILPETDLGGALAVGENIRRQISQSELKRVDTGVKLGAITVSIGAAMFHPKEDSIPLFVKRADEALYRSKQGGRNKVTVESKK